MKQLAIIIIGVILLSSIAVIAIAQIGTNNRQLHYSAEDLILLEEKGFTDLPYSKVTCNPNENCSYYIVRAGKDFVRDLGTSDLKIAEGRVDADIQKFMDDSLAMLKASQTTIKEEEIVGVVEVLPQ